MVVVHLTQWLLNTLEIGLKMVETRLGMVETHLNLNTKSFNTTWQMVETLLDKMIEIHGQWLMHT